MVSSCEKLIRYIAIILFALLNERRFIIITEKLSKQIWKLMLKCISLFLVIRPTFDNNLTFFVVVVGVVVGEITCPEECCFRHWKDSSLQS